MLASDYMPRPFVQNHEMCLRQSLLHHSLTNPRPYSPDGLQCPAKPAKSPLLGVRRSCRRLYNCVRLNSRATLPPRTPIAIPIFLRPTAPTIPPLRYLVVQQCHISSYPGRYLAYAGPEFRPDTRISRLYTPAITRPGRLFTIFLLPLPRLGQCHSFAPASNRSRCLNQSPYPHLYVSMSLFGCSCPHLSRSLVLPAPRSVGAFVLPSPCLFFLARPHRPPPTGLASTPPHSPAHCPVFALPRNSMILGPTPPSPILRPHLI